MNQKIFIRLGGLHCTACVLINEKALLTLPGVTDAKINMSGVTEISYQDSLPEENKIRQIIEKNGYKYLGLITDYNNKSSLENNLNCAQPNKNQKTNWFLIIPALVLMYWLLGRLGGGDFSQLLNGEFSPALALLVGLTAGFSTCLALVGGLVFGLAANYAKNNPLASRFQKFRPHLLFNFGRLGGFFLLGGLLGLLGSTLKISPIFNGLLNISIGIIILILGLKLLEAIPALQKFNFSLPQNWGRKIKANNPVFLGALSFFLPCGFTQSMQVYALSSSSFWSGGLIMALFALGTAPGLLSIGGLASVIKPQKSQLFFKLAGGLIIIFALFNLRGGIHLLKLANSQKPSSTITQNISNNISSQETKKEIRIIKMTETGRGYSPNQFTINKGQPVRWLIDAQAPYSCASSLIVPALNIQRQLKPGLNTIEFTPNTIGDIPFSCSMGMYNGNFKVIE